MELDELQKRWATQDAQANRALGLSQRLVRATEFGAARSALERLRSGLLVELVLGAAALIGLGSFLASHFGDVRFALPAAVLDLAALGTFGATVRQRALAAEVDEDGPVVVSQRRLEALRVLRIRTTQVVLLLAPLLWTPLLVVGLRAFGVDAYQVLGTAYLAANLAFGVAFAVLVLWASRRYGPRLRGSPLLQRLARDIAGASLTEALRRLDSIAAFEAEEVGSA
jgi:hypothetical protein